MSCEFWNALIGTGRLCFVDVIPPYVVTGKGYMIGGYVASSPI